MGSLKSDTPQASAYRFGRYLLDADRGVLLREGIEVPLRAQSYEVLTLLVRQAGSLVTRQDFHDRIWQGKVVTDSSITQCLVEIRAAIDDAEHAKIRTLARRGYRFEMPVEVVGGAEGQRAAGEAWHTQSPTTTSTGISNR